MRRARTAAIDRRLARLAAVDLLILDDLGLHPLRHDEPTDLYELIRVRYEVGPIVITSNRDIETWPPLFGDALLASAAMDRLLHHAHVIDVEGDVLQEPAQQAAAAQSQGRVRIRSPGPPMPGASRVRHWRRPPDQICRTAGDQVGRPLTP